MGSISYLYDGSYDWIEPPEDAWKANPENNWIQPSIEIAGGRGNGKTILSNRELEYLKADKNITMEVAKMYWEKSNLPKIKKVIFNYPATIIIWEDGSKTVVKLMNGDTWDPEKGFAMAYLKKLLGTQRLRKEIKKYVKPRENLEAGLDGASDFLNNPVEYLKAVEKALKKVFDINDADKEDKK